MSDTGTENHLKLNECQRTGTVELPDCELVISYQESKNSTRTEEGEAFESSRLGLHTGGTGSPLANDEVRRELVYVLLDIPGIFDRETRDTLFAEIPEDWQEKLGPRPTKTKNDLIQTLKNVKQWSQQTNEIGPIESVIKNAMILAQGSKSLQDELREHLRRLGRDWQSFRSAVSMPDSEEAS